MIEQKEGERLRDYASRLQEEENRLWQRLKKLYKETQDNHAEIMQLLKDIGDHAEALGRIFTELLQED